MKKNKKILRGEIHTSKDYIVMVDVIEIEIRIDIRNGVGSGEAILVLDWITGEGSLI